MSLGMRGALAICLGLALTLGVKAVVEQPVDYAKLNSKLLGVAREALLAQGFTLMAETDFRAVQAFKGACFITIGNSSAEGGTDSSFAASYGSTGRLLFWRRRALYDHRPVVQALTDRYLVRLEQIFSGQTILHPTYHLVVSDDCSETEIRALRLDDVSDKR